MTSGLPALTDEQLAQYEEDGYFVVRQVIRPQTAMEVRGVIRNHVLTPDLDARRDEIDPMDPMDDSPDARAARWRKLGNFCSRSPLIWHSIHAAEPLLRLAQRFLGDDLLLKYNSCFLKPAHTGSATPWHQDNGLWRDGETEPFNFWMAIDPATRANGCLQFIPGSHKGEIIPHVLYRDSIHGELPRHRVEQLIDRHGVHHIELEPGDIVCWHSTLCHYSPPNTSAQGRIGVAGVYSTPAVARRRPFPQTYQWCMRGGEVVTAFPPEQVTLGETGGVQPAFFAVAEPTAAAP